MYYIQKYLVQSDRKCNKKYNPQMTMQIEIVDATIPKRRADRSARAITATADAHRDTHVGVVAA